MKEYQPAVRSTVLQCFIETCADILSGAKHFILHFKKGKHLYIMFMLRYFITICNTNEYKMMGQDASLGQLYDVHDKIKILKKHWLALRIY